MTGSSGRSSQPASKLWMWARSPPPSSLGGQRPRRSRPARRRQRGATSRACGWARSGVGAILVSRRQLELDPRIPRVTGGEALVDARTLSSPSLRAIFHQDGARQRLQKPPYARVAPYIVPACADLTANTKKHTETQLEYARAAAKAVATQSAARLIFRSTSQIIPRLIAASPTSTSRMCSTGRY